MSEPLLRRAQMRTYRPTTKVSPGRKRIGVEDKEEFVEPESPSPSPLPPVSFRASTIVSHKQNQRLSSASDLRGSYDKNTPSRQPSSSRTTSFTSPSENTRSPYSHSRSNVDTSNRRQQETTSFTSPSQISPGKLQRAPMSSLLASESVRAEALRSKAIRSTSVDSLQHTTFEPPSRTTYSSLSRRDSTRREGKSVAYHSDSESEPEQQEHRHRHQYGYGSEVDNADRCVWFL